MNLIGRKIYLDWGDKIIAITVYKNGHKPKNAKFTQPDEKETKSELLKGQNIPCVVDLIDFDGEEIEMNPQPTAMPHWYGREISEYLHSGFYTKEDKKKTS